MHVSPQRLFTCFSPCPLSAVQASDYASKIGRLGFVAGLIPQQKLDSFERILFRATRGNVFVRSSSVGRVRDPSSGEQLEKSAFVVFFAGDRSKTKIMKVCLTSSKTPRLGNLELVEASIRRRHLV